MRSCYYPSTLIKPHVLLDFLCFSWKFRTLSGQESIRVYLSEHVGDQSRFEHASPRNFKVDSDNVNAPSQFRLPGSRGTEGIQGAFTFSITHPAAYGRGFFRLVQDVDGTWKALTLFTNMQDLVGYEEASASQRDLHEDRKMTWKDDLDQKFRAIEADPIVLIGM